MPWLEENVTLQGFALVTAEMFFELFTRDWLCLVSEAVPSASPTMYVVIL
jgi:hypothetical protein